MGKEAPWRNPLSHRSCAAGHAGAEDRDEPDRRERRPNAGRPAPLAAEVVSAPIQDLGALLRSMEPTLHPGVYVFVPVADPAALASAEVVATMREPEGLSAILSEPEAVALGLPTLFRAAWITLAVASDLHAIGFTAACATALAGAGIACNVVAGARHDHLFVPVERGADAVAALRRLQESSSA